LLRNSINDKRVLVDFVAGHSNGNGSDGSVSFSRSERGDDRTAQRSLGARIVPIVPTGRRMLEFGPEQNSADLADGLLNATGMTGHRDPISVYQTEILGRLLEPIRPAAWGGRPVLWPLWANEMVHRTYVTIHLTALLISKLRFDGDTSLRCELDYAVASNLAAAFGELVVVHDNERLPCSAIIRGIARNFVELFGPVAGNIGIATRIEPLLLAAFKRRALVLVVVELISQALIYAFRGFDAGQIEVHLLRISRSRARLTVKNSSGNLPAYVAKSCRRIGNDLASLLEAEIVYGVAAFDGTLAQIDFRI
jgi:hypothetical protein